MREILRQKILDAEATPVPPFTPRDVHVPAVPGKALAVIGMRRSGKTTFLWQLLAERLAAGAPREGILFVGFDDDRLAGMTAADLGVLLEEYYALHPEWREDRRPLFLFDEIQLVEGWERFARRLLDTERVDLVVSGSSARMLSREVASSMRGRAMEVLVLPFSFREFLRHRGKEPGGDPARLPKAKRSALRRELETYLEVGGFPEAQGLDVRDRWELLRTYVDVVLLRDVIERHGISQPVALRQMTRHLLAHAAGPFSVNRFHNDLKSRGFRVSKDSLHAWFAHLEDAFLVHGVWLATESERQRMVNPRKVYPVDPALIPLYDRSGRVQPSKALETVVFLELLRRGAEVSYVKTREGYEVDFLARWPGGATDLVQVATSLDDPATLERETRALLSAADEHPTARLLLVTMTPEATRDVPAAIDLLPAWSWLLATEP